MTNGTANELPWPWRNSSPRKGAAVAFAVVLVFGLVCTLLAGGHPRSNWYYPFIVALAGIAAARHYRRIVRARRGPPRQVSSEAASLACSVAEGVITAGLAFLLFALLWDEPMTGGVPIFLGLMTAVSGYRQRRGLPHSNRVSIILGAGILIILAAVLFVVRRMR